MSVDLMRIFSREVRSRRREKREEGEKEKEKNKNKNKPVMKRESMGWNKFKEIE
jgi:hypothetical protein